MVVVVVVVVLVLVVLVVLVLVLSARANLVDHGPIKPAYDDHCDPQGEPHLAQEIYLSDDEEHIKPLAAFVRIGLHHTSGGWLVSVKNFVNCMFIVYRAAMSDDH